jgi:hypothetical protein
VRSQPWCYLFAFGRFGLTLGSANEDNAQPFFTMGYIIGEPTNTASRIEVLSGSFNNPVLMADACDHEPGAAPKNMWSGIAPVVDMQASVRAACL